MPYCYNYLEMSTSDLNLLLGLVEKACLVLVVFYLLSCIKLFESALKRSPNAGTKVLIAVIFGIMAIYGTYSGVPTTGAIANIRNLGPMIAGLIGGPWVGLGAGLIGGVHRYFLGGFTALPCALGTVISGLAMGFLYLGLKGKIGIWRPILLAFGIEIADMGLILLIARPFSEAVNLVKIIAMPMILGNTIGVAVFAYMLGIITHKGEKVEGEESSIKWLKRSTGNISSRVQKLV